MVMEEVEQQMPMEEIAMLPTEKLLLRAQKLQRDIIRDLRQQYSKALDPDFRPNFFYRSYRFDHIKRPIVYNLEKYHEFDILTLPQLAYFLNQYKSFVEINSENDPTNWTSTLWKKHSGGELGSIFTSHRHELIAIERTFEDLLDEISTLADLKKEWYQNALAIIEEMEFTKWLDEEVKNYSNLTYHIIKLDELKKKLLESKCDSVVTEIKNIEKLSKEEQRNVLRAKIAECNKENMAVDLTRMVMIKSLEAKIPIDKIKYIMWRSILSNFIDTLLVEEKQFFWRWCLHAKFDQLNDYFNHKSYHPLLNVEDLKRKFATLEHGISNEKEIMEKFNQYCEEDLNEYHEFASKGVGKTLIGFNECEWKAYLASYITDQLITPLRIMNTLVDKAEADPEYVPNEDEQLFYELYLHLKINIYQVDYLESENVPKPVSQLVR